MANIEKIEEYFTGIYSNKDEIISKIQEFFHLPREKKKVYGVYEINNEYSAWFPIVNKNNKTFFNYKKEDDGMFYHKEYNQNEENYDDLAKIIEDYRLDSTTIKQRLTPVSDVADYITFVRNTENGKLTYDGMHRQIGVLLPSYIKVAEKIDIGLNSTFEL